MRSDVMCRVVLVCRAPSKPMMAVSQKARGTAVVARSSCSLSEETSDTASEDTSDDDDDDDDDDNDDDEKAVIAAVDLSPPTLDQKPADDTLQQVLT